MFKIFSKSQSNLIYAPVEGKCIDISEVPDLAFSEKSMGDGVAIIPVSNIICSPCDGTLVMIFRTRHAFGIKADNGLELLIHIGIDTVNLNGKWFTALKKANTRVKKGEPIIKIDLESITKEYDPTTMIIITNAKEVTKLNINQTVQLNDKILEVV